MTFKRNKIMGHSTSWFQTRKKMTLKSALWMMRKENCFRTSHWRR